MSESCPSCDEDLEDYGSIQCSDCGEDGCGACSCGDCDRCDDCCLCKCSVCDTKDWQMTETKEGNVCRGCYVYCSGCHNRQHPKGMAADKICNSCAENMARCEACGVYMDEYDAVSCVECENTYCDWCSDEPENMTRTEDDEPICRDCAPVKSAETFESMGWYDPGEDTNNLERAFRREYPRYTLDSGSMEYLIYQGGASNKFHIFFVAQDDGGQYHAFNAYGRIGYNPRIQYIGGPYSTKASAEYAFGKKMGQKTKKGYRPFGAEGSGSISAYTTIPYSWETDPDPHEHDEHIDDYDIENAIEYEVDQEVRSGNRTGSSTYTTKVGYDDPEDEDRYIQEDLEVYYRWGAEGSGGKYSAEELSVKEPFQTGFKLTLGVISAGVVGTLGLSALGMILAGLRNGDE